MKLPNGNRAVIDRRKLVAYCLDPSHPRGANKARVFRASLGITASDADELSGIIADAARESDQATQTEQIQHGTIYRLDIPISRRSRFATVRSIWIIRQSEDFPRLITCFVL